MSKLIELVEEYGDQCFVHGRDEIPQNRMIAAGRERALLGVIRAAVAELERDAARFHYLQNIDKKEAQAFFWHFESRKQRAKAIDAAMEAANVPEL